MRSTRALSILIRVVGLVVVVLVVVVVGGVFNTLNIHIYKTRSS